MSNLRRRSNVRYAPLFALSLLPLMISATAQAAGGAALPTGGKVVAGSAMISAVPIFPDPIFHGLAISLVFGLFSSTFLTLLVIPAIYIVLRDDGMAESK